MWVTEHGHSLEEGGINNKQRQFTGYVGTSSRNWVAANWAGGVGFPGVVFTLAYQLTETQTPATVLLTDIMSFLPNLSIS